MASRDKKDKERESKERKDRRDSRIASLSASVLELKIPKEPTAEAAGKCEGLDEKFDRFQNEMRGFFKKLDDSIDEKINNLNDKFTSRFDDLKVEIGALKTEIEGNNQILC